MIYIDPPYNTGKDFIYKDNFTAKKADYEEELGATDEEDNKLFKNTDTNGRFHSDWLSMMYERLIVARDLLKDDGGIFISIDDNEVHNLRGICDEVFGEENFVANVAWKHTQQSKNDEPHFSRNYNSLVIYKKSEGLKKFRLPRTKEDNKNYSNPDNDPKGDWRSGDVRSPNLRKTLRYNIMTPSERIIEPPQNGWRWSESEVKKKISTGEIIFSKNEDRIIRKIYLSNQDGRTPENVWVDDSSGTTRQANAEMKDLFNGNSTFDTPKPTMLVKKIAQLFREEKDFLVLDFFSGSSTSAHAVMQLNAEDNGNRKFIMVQLPEVTDEKSEAYKAGYKNIAEIGKERIRRAGNKIVEDNQDKEGIDKLDIGFRVYKTDSSNMKEVYYHPEQLTQDDIFSLESNIKEGRKPDDLLTQVILDLGLELNLPIEQKEMYGNNVFIVQTNALVACFDDNINIKIIDEIAELKPFKVVFKDASFAASKDRINLEERFKRLSPETLITVI